jgi:hypothetical protein
MLGIQWYNNITIGEPYHLLEEQNGEWWCGLDSIMWDCVGLGSDYNNVYKKQSQNDYRV